MSDARIAAGIVGISGYSGMELARILAAHPNFDLRLAVTDRWAGQALGEKLPLGGATASIVCLSQAEGVKRFEGLQVVFLCTPHEASMQIAPSSLAAGARVVDLSGAFRLPASEYPKWYGFSHGNPALLAEAVYSMPEVTQNQWRLPAARLVSNPGCYATAATLAVLPLLRAGLIEPGSLIVDAKSGTTGAGRKATEDMSFSEVGEDFRAYRILRHQHTPEIEQALTAGGVAKANVVLTPHLLPVRRGILATAYGRLTATGRASDPGAAATRAMEDFARGKPFMRVLPAAEVTLRATVGTNRVALGAAADIDRGIVVSLASLDNLVKGAAGQAVQNANLMFGLPETTGLL